MSRFDPAFTAILDAASARHNRRVLRAVEPRRGPVVERAGRLLVNFSGNDYLGLSQHPLLIERSQEWTARWGAGSGRSEEHTSELQSLMRISYAVFCLKKKKQHM